MGHQYVGFCGRHLDSCGDLLGAIWPILLELGEVPHTRQHWSVCKALRVLCMRQSFNLCQDPTCCIRAPTPKLAVGHRYLAVVPQCHIFDTRNQAMLLGSCMQHSGAYGTSTWSCSQHAGAWGTSAWDFADTTWARVAIYLEPSGQYCWSLGHQYVGFCGSHACVIVQ